MLRSLAFRFISRFLIIALVSHAACSARETLNFNRDWKFQLGDPKSAEAVAYADKAVRMSQGTGREKDMSAVQSPSSEAFRFFTMFYTPFNVMFNAQWQGVRGLKKGNVRPMIAVTCG